MLPKLLRLNSQTAAGVKRMGKTLYSSRFKIIILKRSDNALPQWQIKVFKKTCPKSTDRNHAKRIIREAIRKTDPNILLGAKIIIQLTKQIDQASPAQLSSEIKKALQHKVI